MATKELTYIKSENLVNDFEQHLDDEFNERILFSAPFGAGKSTFLHNFFDKNKNYVTLKLYPVNYSVAANQDVFELIKYELLYELLSRFPEDIQLDQDQFSILLISQMFILHKMKIDLPLKLLSKASSLVSGVPLADDKIIDSITQLVSSVSDYKKEINQTEYDLLNKYIKDTQTQKGHVYECDNITQLIVSLLDRIKEKKNGSKSKVKTVLLIDDLDRLDPEHVFRLFNVFSAHYEDVTESNKFQFDKIIFVCDVKNIREMFNHRYGFNVEFTGYIDKFYSTEIFKFDIKRYLRESLPQIFDESKYNPYKYFKPEEIGDSLVDRYKLNHRGPFYEALLYILKDMINLDIVHIRNFKRFNQFTLPNNKIETKYGNIAAVFYPFIVLLSNLEKIFIHQVDLETALEQIYKNYNSNYEPVHANNRDQSDHYADRIIQYSIPFILDEKNAFGHDYDMNAQRICPFKNENGESIYFVYEIHQDHEYRVYWQKFIKCTLDGNVINNIAVGTAIIRPNPYWFLFKAYKNFKSKRYF